MKNLSRLVCLVSALAVPSFGQVANPVIGGYPVSCSDATGAVVYTFLAPIPGDSAQSGILPNGIRFIKLDPQKFVGMPPILQLFIYAHECGHHISGDIVAGVFFHHDNPAREMNADRIGIRLMRDQLNITLQQAQLIASFFQNNPPIPPYYLPGPQRAQWIVDCYNSSNATCNGSKADYGKTDEDGGSPDVDPDPQPAPKKHTDSEEKRAACRRDYESCLAKIVPANQCVQNNVNACSASCTNPYYCNCSPQHFYPGCSENEHSDRQSCREDRDNCLSDADSDNSNDDSDN